MAQLTCAARTFCACPDCRSFSFDSEGGKYRGTPITVRAERQLVKHRDRVPTHRKATA